MPILTFYQAKILFLTDASDEIAPSLKVFWPALPLQQGILIATNSG